MNQKTNFSQGNMSKVFGDGDAVYREMNTQSKTIHRLLRHLEKKNIYFVPRVLGVDEEKNQEKLSFIEGETIENYPLTTDMACKIETIRMVATMLKKYHDATLDFQQNKDDTWFLRYEGSLVADVICHNDFAPYNVTFKQYKPIGIIDFDTACPAPRIWDVAYAIYRFVPLSEVVYISDKQIYRKYDKKRDGLERRTLIKAFVEAYGVHFSDFIMENVILRIQALVSLFDEECQKGNTAFIKMRAEGHQGFYIREIEFIKQNMRDWI